MSSSQTRLRLLETAARLFQEKGYEGTPVATILNQAGVNSGSLYHAYGGKQGLLCGVLQHYLDTLDAQVMAPAAEFASDGIGRVFALLRRYRDGLEASGCTRGCPVGNLALELSDSKPDVRTLVHANFERWLDTVEGWLVEAGERLPADLDRRGLARFALTTMEGGIMQALAARSLEPFDQSVAHLRRYVDFLERSARPRSRRGPNGRAP